MKKVEKRALKSDKQEEKTIKKLFIKFLSSLPNFYLQNNKTVPFTVAKIVLTNFRIREEEAKKFLNEFVRLGLLQIVKFRGYKLNVRNVLRLLRKKYIVEFCNDCKINMEKLNALKLWKN